MKFNFLFKSIFLVALILAISSCDKDLNTIGTDVLGNNDHYGIITDSSSTTIAYNVATTGAVQTNNLPVNSLGFYQNDVFGTTTSNYITQLSLATTSPVFIKPAASIKIDSVYLHVPYFYTPVSIDEASGDTAFKEDSLIGNSKIKLEVFRSGFFLENLDSSPGSGLTDPKKYFSDENFNTSLVSGRLNNGVASENDNFEFKKTQIKIFKNLAAGQTTPTVRERLAPGLFMMLDSVYFKNNIIKANPTVLSNNTLFRDYFRALYFKVSPSPSDPSAKGAMNRLNFALGKITIVYQDNKSTTETAQVKKSLVINLSGNTVNTFTDNFKSTYLSSISPTNNSPVAGSNRLYLKGGAGSMAVLSLFGGNANNTSNGELQKFRDQKCLINDASITFTIDKTAGAMNTELEPRRIFLFDLENRTPLIDYYADFTTASNPKFAKFEHGGIIKLNSNKRGTTYKIKITNHVQNLVRDLTRKNVKLGLVVSESIGVLGDYALRNPFSYLTNPNSTYPTGQVISAAALPVMSYCNPLGTILYGTNLPAADPKKLKLVIRYTKPD